MNEPSYNNGIIPTINSRGKLVFGNEMVSDEGEGSDKEVEVKTHKKFVGNPNT
jgi:hypothetical protein